MQDDSVGCSKRMISLFLINLCMDEVGVIALMVGGAIAWELIEHGMVG